MYHFNNQGFHTTTRRHKAGSAIFFKHLLHLHWGLFAITDKAYIVSPCRCVKPTFIIKKLRLHLVFIFWAITFGVKIFGQPLNDDCWNAKRIANVNNWCSSPAQFTNVFATPSGVGNPGCFPNFSFDSGSDVWFKFTAIGTTVHISVTGQIDKDPKGSLHYPQLALYKGDCSNLQNVSCLSDARGYNIVESFAGPLVIGATYYIRVDARHDQTGTFQLCVNNFNDVPSPSSDCATGVILCDKSSFTVPSVRGGGKNRHELEGVCLPAESSSSWYKWTCDRPGTLTFVLEPVNPSDDIDFALYVLPNGVDDCQLKFPVRCMASGENVDNPLVTWEKCTGATGLRLGAIDIMEDEGCKLTDDNFVAALDMETGESYALIINNFSNTGNGFSIEFGGTGTFEGPTASFTLSPKSVDVGKAISIEDASNFSGGIAKWEWNFGVGAIPANANGKGPYKVKFGAPGKKSVRLTVESKRGCRVTKVKTIQVKPLPEKKLPPKEKPAKSLEKTKPLSSAKPGIEKAVENEAVPSISGAPKDENEAVAVGPNEEDNPQNEATSGQTRASSGSLAGAKTIIWEIFHVTIIYFDSDSFNLVDEHFAYLDEIVQMLKESPETIALVEGYTNNIPPSDYCERLASNRATSVKDYLVRHGISADRLRDKVYGKKKPRANNKTLSGRRKNQRVEVKVMKKLE